MKNRTFFLTILFAIIGLVIGYWLFGHINGNYLSPGDLFITEKDNFLSSLVKSSMGVEEIRNRIFLSCAAGGVFGFIIGLISSRKKSY